MTKWFLVLLLLLTTACATSLQKEDQVEYKFFVAGHVYGKPGESEVNIGVHPPFKAKLGMIKNDADIAFGVFTGDMVYHGAKEKEWDELDEDITATNKQVYFAPGNHDIGNSKKRVVFKKRYGSTYRSFMHNKDLFIILDPNLKGWNIVGEQLNWLKDEVATKGGKAKNIFVFFHQILWWAKDNTYKDYPPNSPSGRAEKINFFTEIYPLFKALSNQVYMFAGDTGVYERGVMYHKKDNITFIASGMGGRKQDNFVVVNINKNNTVSFQLVALNGGDTNALGKLEDFVIP